LTVFNLDASKADSKISKTFFKSIVVIFELRNALLPLIGLANNAFPIKSF